jgi:hypothetical protein
VKIAAIASSGIETAIDPSTISFTASSGMTGNRADSGNPVRDAN